MEIDKTELQAILTIGLIIALVLVIYFGIAPEIQKSIIGLLLTKFGIESSYYVLKKRVF